MKQKLLTLIRVVVSVGIISFFLVFQKETLRTFLTSIQEADFKWLLFALCGYIPVMILSILRWDALLKVQGVHLKAPVLTRLFLIGTFFNHFTLGVTGGDVIKAYYVAKETPTHKAETVLTVFLDRVIGMVALFSLALIALFFADHTMELQSIRRIIFALFLGSILFCILLFNKRLLKRIPKLESMMQKLPFYDALRKIYNAFHLYHRHKRILLLTYFYSLMLQSVMMVVIYMLSFAFDIQGTHLIHYFLFFPIIAAVSALPISLGGLGVGEAGFVYFFGLIGVSSGKAFALGLSTRFVWILWGLLGGLLYILPSNKIRKEAQATEELKLENI